MELYSHLRPINPQKLAGQIEVGSLVDAFTEFISASTRLESSYGQLQQEVTRLSDELAERNSALKVSLAENERVHRALQRIVDSMPCGVLVVEGDGSVSMINPEVRRLLDLNHSPAEHLDAISLAAGVDLAGFLKGRVAGDRESGRDMGRENEQEREFSKIVGGRRRWFSVRERCLFHGGEPGVHGRRQTILILRDITLHKQAEEERDRARKASALSEVAMTLAHEIRNPLASLELFAGLIAAGGDDTSEWVSHLHAGIRSLAGTVNNVLSFHGVGFPALSPLDLIASIRSSVDFVRPIADQAGISLAFDADDAGLWVSGNGGALQQLVLNMVSNSLRHTAIGGNVWVAVRRDHAAKDALQNCAVIEFSDTGCGIEPEDIDEVFRPGFSASGHSSGLGLAVCNQIVRQHEGSIRVVSTVGVGTTFYVEIPSL